MFLYLSKFRIHPLQIITLLLLSFWRSHYKSPRAYVQSPARNVEGDGSRYSLTTGGNPKQGDLSQQHIYLQCSCVSLPHLTLVPCGDLPARFYSGGHWANKPFPQDTEEVKGAIAVRRSPTPYYFLGYRQQKLNSADLRIDLLVHKQIQHSWKKSKKMLRSEPVSMSVCYWNMPKSEKQKRHLKNLFSSHL